MADGRAWSHFYRLPFYKVVLLLVLIHVSVLIVAIVPLPKLSITSTDISRQNNKNDSTFAKGTSSFKTFKFGDRIHPRLSATTAGPASGNGKQILINDVAQIKDDAGNEFEEPVPFKRGKSIRTEDSTEYSTKWMITDQVATLKADRLEMSTDYFVVPTVTTPTASQRGLSSSTIRPNLVLSPRSPYLGLGNVTASRIASIGLRNEPWVIPLLSLSSLVMILMASFEIYVLYKAIHTCPSRRHLFLGQMLLLGLFVSAGLSALLTLTPTQYSCAVVRFGVGVAYALVFASLLVKCVFLISLNSGGVYLPAPYQGLLLFFAVLIQVVIGVQWLITQPASVHIIMENFENRLIKSYAHPLGNVTRVHHLGLGEEIPVCRTPFVNLLMSLTYCCTLLVFVAILAIKSRGIRDNYREANYIGLAVMCGVVPIWFAWTLCGLTVGDRHVDGCLAFGLIAISSSVFFVMFMPKGRQLAAMGKEGVYIEDREEQFSSLSRAGSGYSSSFFHFKPIKYGVMTSTSTTDTSTENNHKNSKHTSPHNNIGGLLLRADDVYTSLDGPRLPSSNPNVYFHRSSSVHPGMMY